MQGTSADTAVAGDKKVLSEDEERKVVQRYQDLKRELSMIYNKITEIEGDRAEHEVVLKHLKKLNSDRRCWQQVGGSLNETTVSELLGVLSSQMENIESTKEKMLADEVKWRETELTTLKSKYDIRELPRQALDGS